MVESGAGSTGAGRVPRNDVRMWKQRGRVSLWRYTENERNYPGWHLNADRAGCESLLSLLDWLASSPGTCRTVAITAPTPLQLAVPGNRRGWAAWRAPDRLRLACSAAPSAWEFPPDLKPASLIVGPEWLQALRTGIAGIAEGQGDHSIGDRGNGSLPLWLWW